jgi:predicted phage terminase large subunit-like protein
VVADRTGLVERIYDLATKQQVDVVLIEHKTRGTDLYQELQKETMEWPFALEYWEPAGKKAIRLEACVPLFVNERVWAPDKTWSEVVISEVEAQPHGAYDDLSDTMSAALQYLRGKGLLSLGDEYAREARRERMFAGQRREPVRQLYEGV